MFVVCSPSFCGSRGSCHYGWRAPYWFFFFWLRIAQSPQSCLVPYLRNKFKVIIIKSRAKCKRTIIVENKWMTICLAAPQINNPLNVLTTLQIKLLANRQFNLFCFYCNSILSSGAVYGLSSGSYARNELFFCSRLSASVILCIIVGGCRRPWPEHLFI